LKKKLKNVGKKKYLKKYLYTDGKQKKRIKKYSATMDEKKTIPPVKIARCVTCWRDFPIKFMIITRSWGEDVEFCSESCQQRYNPRG